MGQKKLLKGNAQERVQEQRHQEQREDRPPVAEDFQKFLAHQPTQAAQPIPPGGLPRNRRIRGRNFHAASFYRVGSLCILCSLPFSRSP